jgi:dolichol-phosphate mannosyltransferase
MCYINCLTMRAIVVVPTYNEAANLEPLVQQIQQHANGLHILIVDDNSPDGTGKLADELSEKHSSSVFVIHRKQKEGLGPAYVHGFTRALNEGYDVIVQMDADLSHDPSSLPQFLEQIGSADAVIGSRYMHGVSVLNWDFKRLMLSKFATKYIQMITRLPLSDATGGYNCWRRQTLEAVGFEGAFSNGYLFSAELKYKAYRKKFKLIEIPIVFTERDLGESKMNWGIIWEAIWGVFKLRIRY